MKNILLLLFLTTVTSCGYTPLPADSQAILSLINKTATNTEICIKDIEFHFPDVIIGPKYSGKSLAKLDALVSAGLLRETEEILSEPKHGPKYVYHYKQNNLIERKAFYLTDQGMNFYRSDQSIGYFCYGHPGKVELGEIDSAKNDQGNIVLTATFLYEIELNPDATWISNPWVQREFSLAHQRPNKPNAQQQFIKTSQNLIRPFSPGILDSHYW